MRFSGIWRSLSLSRQLLISVNSFLVVIVGMFLFLDHRTRLSTELEQTRVSLTEEAKTIHESVVAVEAAGPNAIQNLIDSVCARMNSDESPGHHIAVQRDGQTLQAKSHGQASSGMFSAMQIAAERANGRSVMAESIVAGAFEGPGGTVYVSEQKSKVILAAREALAMQMLAMLAAAAIAALIVNVLLRRVISKPIGAMVTALQGVAGGDLSVIAEGKSCKELTYLADQINEMTRSLDAVERDRRFQMETARRIQQHLLPKRTGLNGLKVAELFEPAEEVGGDYFDVVPLSEHEYLLCLADVTGHGVPAAMAATVMKALVLEAVHASKSPGEILTRINHRYCEIIMPGHLATMVVLVVDTRRCVISYACAGHEPPFMQTPDGKVCRLVEADLVLGVDDDVIYDQEVLEVEQGTKIVLVSDGVTEMFDPDENQFGTERVVSVLEATQGKPVDQVVEGFVESLSRFSKSRPAFDDTTLLIAEVSPSESDR